MFNGVASPLVQVQIKERQIGIPLRFPPRRRSPATFNSNNKDLKGHPQRQPAKVKEFLREKPQLSLKSVNVSQGSVYIPRRTKPILLKSPAARQKLSTADPRWGRVVLHRSMTENGGTLFTLGTRSGDTITQDAEDVPFNQILHHVTPSELTRFENADYEVEDEAERIRLENMKPRGRPRKDGTAPASGLQIPKTPKPKPPGLTSGGYSAFRGEGQPKKRGRPVGWRKHNVPAAPGGPVPSFNGPQPMGEADTEPEMSTREQTEDLAEKRLDLQAKTGVYSMVSASGLGPQVPDSETEMDTKEPTREPTPLRNDEIADEPTPKRRRVDVHVSSPSTPFETAPPSPMIQSRSTSDEDERLNLLDQFTSNSLKNTPYRPKSDTPKRHHQATSNGEPDQLIRSSSDEDERLNLLDQFNSNPQQNTPHRPNIDAPKRHEQPTIKPQPKRPSRSSSDEDERLNLLDQFNSNRQQNTPNRPNIDAPKRHEQPTIKPQPKRPSRSSSDEDERLTLLEQFTAKPHEIPSRSTATSSQDSMLSSVHYVSPTKQPSAPPPNLPPSRSALRPTNPTRTTPQRPSKRTSLTPHYPGSAGGVIPITIAIIDDKTYRRRRGPSTISPSQTRSTNENNKNSPSKPATTAPAPPYRPTSSSKPHKLQPQQQRPNTRPTNSSNPNTTPRPSTRSSSSLNTYQADAVRAMDSYFSPRKHTTTANKSQNIDPRLRSSRTASSTSISSDEGGSGESGESFMGVAEVPAPARPVERPVERQVGTKATAVRVLVVSPGGAKGGSGVARRAARGMVDGRTDDSRPRNIGQDSIQSRSHGMTAEQRNGTNSHPDTRTVVSEDGEESEDEEEEDEDDDEGSIEL